MDISPASALQVMDSGDLIEISDDILGVARDLREIDPELKLRYSEDQDIWVVYQERRHPITGELQMRQLVTTQRSPLMPAALVERVRMVTNEGYDFVAEMERAEKKAKRDHEHELREARGPALERLAHAMQKDLGYDQGRVFVPRALELPPGVAR
jgi:hypothetical protein